MLKLLLVKEKNEQNIGDRHVGIVSTLDAHQGLIIVRVTPDTQALAEQILLHMPFALQILPPL